MLPLLVLLLVHPRHHHHSHPLLQLDRQPCKHADKQAKTLCMTAQQHTIYTIPMP
jgi:hypothetical protein